jgi:hypothetical protein
MKELHLESGISFRLVPAQIDSDYDARNARQAAARSAIGLLLDQFDLAAILDVSLSMLRNWRQQGAGPPFVRIAGRPYYRIADVCHWIDSLPVEERGQIRTRKNQREARSAPRKDKAEVR